MIELCKSGIYNNLPIVKFNADGTVTGALKGSWKITDGNKLKLEIDERTGSKIFVIDEKNKEQNTKI